MRAMMGSALGGADFEWAKTGDLRTEYMEVMGRLRVRCIAVLGILMCRCIAGFSLVPNFWTIFVKCTFLYRF